MHDIGETESAAQDGRLLRSRLQAPRAALVTVICVIATSACEPQAGQSTDVTVSSAELLQAERASAGAPAPASQAERGPSGKRWREPVFLGRNPGDAHVPSLAVAASGEALVGWAQTDRMGVHVESAHYAADSGWSDATLAPRTVGDAEQVHVALADGQGVLVWNERPNPLQVSGLGATWSSAQGYGSIKELLRYDPTLAFTYGPRLAGHGDGRAIALWGYSVGRGVAIQAFRYEPATGWGALTKLQLDPAPTRQPIVQEADVSLSARGVAFTTFASYGDAWVNRSTAQDPVGVATRLAAATADSGAGTPSVASDALGRALAVWTQFDPGRQSIMAARYASGAWSSPAALTETAVATDTSPYTEPARARALLTAFGQPCAAFIRPEPQHTDVWTSCYTGRRWTQALHVDVADAGQSQALEVAADGVGGWVVVWARAAGDAQHIYANRYVLGRGWSGPTRLDPGAGSSQDPQVGLDRDGHGFAAWAQGFGYMRVLVSRLE